MWKDKLKVAYSWHKKWHAYIFDNRCVVSITSFILIYLVFLDYKWKILKRYIEKKNIIALNSDG